MLAGSVVAGQRDHLGAGLAATLAIHRHVGVAEPVDALELVADQEQPVARDPVDQRHLQPVGVLKLIHHHLGEPLPILSRQLRRAFQQLDCAQLEIVEVDQRPAVLELLIAACELLQEHVQLGQVGDGRRIARRLHEIPTSLLVVSARARSDHLERLQVDQLGGIGAGVQERHQVGGLLLVTRGSRCPYGVGGSVHVGLAVRTQIQRPARASQPLVGLQQQLPQPPPRIRR